MQSFDHLITTRPHEVRQVLLAICIYRLKSLP